MAPTFDIHGTSSHVNTMDSASVQSTQGAEHPHGVTIEITTEIKAVLCKCRDKSNM